MAQAVLPPDPGTDTADTTGTLFPRKINLRVPTKSEMARDFESVRLWAREIDALEQRCRIEHREFNHRELGKNRLPAALWFDTPEQAARFIGETTALTTVRERAKELLEYEPRLKAWVNRKPLKLVELDDRIARLTAVHAWIIARPRPDCYLREVDVAGVDTKFIETHREVLAQWLDLTLPTSEIDDSARGLSGFIQRYGFRERQPRIRMRSLDPALPLIQSNDGVLLSQADIALDVDSAAQLAPAHSRVLIVENEINYLALPDLPDTIALFGSGYGHAAIAKLQWLAGLELIYWGDIDTHGFAILNELRARWPKVRSILMDRETLLEHRTLWGQESSPTRAELAHLDDDERSLYAALVADVYGPQLRLEQERIRQGWLLDALHV